MKSVIKFLLILLLTSILLYMVIPIGNGNKYNEPFNQDKWMSSGCTVAREYMVNDLEKNYLPNATKEEIVKLLGPSFSNPTSSKSKELYAYCLGPRFGGFDNKFLIVLIDNEGNFMETEHATF